MSLICNIVGARPNFMKMAPVVLEARRRGLPQICVHTGQHYDTQMSDIFFRELELPEPAIYLKVGSGSHASQTARIMAAFETVCLEHNPDLIVVGGDVNSTLACALTAAKLSIPVAHVESGLRSFDRSMPEEINRVLTDHLATLLFTTELSGNENLRREGIAEASIHFVGNSMIDSLRSHHDRALCTKPWHRFRLKPEAYGLVTLHRPANVDDVKALREIYSALIEIAQKIPLLFPVHPRTRAQIDRYGLRSDSITLAEPLGYLDFLGLMAKARIVLTDSGGVQEETTVLGVPCITVRPNTERPVTVEQGTNRLAGVKKDSIANAALEALSCPKDGHFLPPLWDGRAASRIMDVIQEWR